MAKGAAAPNHKRPYGRKCSSPDHGTGILKDGTSRMSETIPPAPNTATPIPNSFAGDFGQPMFLALSSGTRSAAFFTPGTTGRSGTAFSPWTYDQITLPRNTTSPRSIIQKRNVLGTSV